MPSVQERRRQIEQQEESSRLASQKHHIAWRVVEPGSHSEQFPPHTPHAPPRRIIDCPQARHSGASTSFPSRYRANGWVLDFEGVSLDEGSRPLLPPRPAAEEISEGRRASDGGAVCTLTIKRNPLCDAFEAMSAESPPTRMRSKSLVNGQKKVLPPISVSSDIHVDILKGSDFGTGSTSVDPTEYDPFRAPPRTANPVSTASSSKSLMSTVQGYLKAPHSPSIATMQHHISQSMSPVFSNLRLI